MNGDFIAINDVLETLIDYRGKTPRKTSQGIRLITAKVIKNGTITDTSFEYISEADYDEVMRRGLPAIGDILITTEAPLGEVAQIKSNQKIALAQRVILLRTNPNKMDSKYLLYALQSPLVQAGLYARASGTTVLGIKQPELRKVLVPNPHIEVQQKIASILSAYDNLIENNNRRIAILEEMARSLYREWFIKFRFPGHEEVKMVNSELGQMPEGWRIVDIPEAVEINPTVKIQKNSLNHFVPMDALSERSMVIKYSELKNGNSGSKFMNADTLFARITPSLENGKTAYVQFLSNEQSVGFGSTEFIVFRSKLLTPEYIYCLARSNEFRDNAIKSMTGASGRQRVQNECFNNFLIALPTSDLLNHFSDLVKPMFKAIHNLHKRNSNLKTQRDMLLPKLILGKIKAI